MSTLDDFTNAQRQAAHGEAAHRQAMPEQLAGTVNLMAHPLAGFAAASALGLGLAGHAFGLWAGAVAGAAEASRKLLADLAEDGVETRPAPAARLRLVASQPLPQARESVAKPAAARPAAARKAAARKTAPAQGAPAAQPAAIERPQQPDDLKAIGGIGPKLEKTLNGLGVWTYAQVASLTEAEIAWLDGRYGLGGRIGRDDWTGQAAGLSAGR